MHRVRIKDGHELRGFRIRLYPSTEQENTLLMIEDETRRVWNWLVSLTEMTLAAREAFAERHGYVRARTPRPDYDGLSPAESAARKDAYVAACRRRATDIHEATANVSECAHRSLKEVIAACGVRWEYQAFRKVFSDLKVSNSGTLQALGKRWYSKGLKRRRRRTDRMPLGTRTTECLVLGAFGDRRGKPFYNCAIKYNGLTIRGRLPGKRPDGRVLEGVSIVAEADGWWASVRVEVPVRQLPDPVPGSVVGIDVGLDCVAAMSDGERVENVRGKAYAERIAGRQAMKLPVGRIQQRAARHMRHLIYNRVLKPLATTERIAIEKLSPRIGQMGSTKQSAMRLVRAMLVERYGDRVREVDPCFTSQDCSHCGHRSKESWSYENGRIGMCPACGYSADRDVNAARNIAARASE